MNSATNNRMINNYFRYMRNWDTDSKKSLIIKLTSSIESSSIERHDFSSCFGAWDDDRTSEQIINEIRSSRVNSKEIEEFE